METLTRANGSRPLSGMERLWLTAGRLNPPFAFSLIVELEALPEVAALEAAVARLCAAWPLVRARLRGFGRWSRWVAQGPLPPVLRLPPRAWGEDGAGPELLADLAALPLDPHRGPVAAFALSEGDRPRLIFQALHCAFDGRGGLAVLEGLFAALRGEALPPAPAALHDAAFAARAGGVAATPSLRDRASPYPCTGQAGAKGVIAVRRRLPVPPRPLASLLVALGRASPGRALRVDVPVDLRGPADGAQLGNATGLLRLDLDPLLGAQDPVGAAEARIRAGVAAGEHLGLVLTLDPLRALPLWLLERRGRALQRESRGLEQVAVSATLSNLGRVPLARLSAPGCRATSFWILPPCTDGLPALLTVTGPTDAAGQGWLELSGVAPACWGTPGEFPAWIDRIVAQLR